MIPQSTIPVNDAEIARKVLALMEEFEDHDDIQNKAIDMKAKTFENFGIKEEKQRCARY